MNANPKTNAVIGKLEKIDDDTFKAGLDPENIDTCRHTKVKTIFEGENQSRIEFISLVYSHFTGPL